MTYARSATLSAVRTRNEIKETLERYGADGSAYATQGNLATVIFAMENRRIRFVPELPDPEDFRYINHSLPRARSQRAQQEALLLVIQAKLEAVIAGISTIETEFPANVEPLAVAKTGPSRLSAALPAAQFRPHFINFGVAQDAEHVDAPVLHGYAPEGVAAVLHGDQLHGVLGNVDLPLELHRVGLQGPFHNYHSFSEVIFAPAGATTSPPASRSALLPGSGCPGSG